MITLNSVSLPSPTFLSVRVLPQAGTVQYNTLGQTVLDNMKEKRTVEIGWNRMTGGELATLSALLSPGGFFTLVYPDPLSGSRSMACRIREQSARVYHYQSGVPLWADVKLTLEEK